MGHERMTDRGPAAAKAGRLHKTLVAAASTALLVTAGAGLARAADTQADAPPPAPAWGQHHRHEGKCRHEGKWRGHDGGMRGMMRELNLTDAQKQQIHGILEKSRQEGQALRAKMGGLHQEMHALITSGNYTDAKANEIARKYEPVFAEMAVHATHMMNEVRSVLTPEQRAKADEMAAKRRGHMGGFGGPMGGPMMGPPGGPPPAPPAG